MDIQKLLPAIPQESEIDSLNRLRCPGPDPTALPWLARERIQMMAKVNDSLSFVTEN
jgi:hypothetical protein